MSKRIKENKKEKEKKRKNDNKKRGTIEIDTECERLWNEANYTVNEQHSISEQKSKAQSSNKNDMKVKMVL